MDGWPWWSEALVIIGMLIYLPLGIYAAVRLTNDIVFESDLRLNTVIITILTAAVSVPLTILLWLMLLILMVWDAANISIWRK